MDAKNYIVTCLKCKGSSRIAIVDSKHVIYKDQTPIIASRLRGDLKWGFECACGNDNRLAQIEKKDAELLVQNVTKSKFKQIIDTLKIKDTTQFRMEIA